MNTNTNDKTVSARLTFDVSYLPNGVSLDALKELLQNIAKRAVAEGMVTGHTDAVVVDYKVSVVTLPESLSEDVLTDFMAQRIDNGQISLEDIPNRLARFGLMEPHNFVEEMRERMESGQGN